MNNISYSKLSKKKKKELNTLRRVTWGDFKLCNPATKIIPNKIKEKNKYICRGKCC